MTKVEVCNGLDHKIHISVIKSRTSDMIYVTIREFREEHGIVDSGDYSQFEIVERDIA